MRLSLCFCNLLQLKVIAGVNLSLTPEPRSIIVQAVYLSIKRYVNVPFINVFRISRSSSPIFPSLTPTPTLNCVLLILVDQSLPCQAVPTDLITPTLSSSESSRPPYLCVIMDVESPFISHRYNRSIQITVAPIGLM
ncbi:hypothetical protein GALMADRAFT_224734 [Galerina marginata CBS 339.88]|uniref:Uncharacterized protein n=1 Tax=Galerina marginata (strain CBS 339.88) TaxID=685588 RepID=A0A067T5F4_GALM3|nr:hypothetical protein GALMADRAFT_224734 [Galerina marginata CBS 339.88]